MGFAELESGPEVDPGVMEDRKSGHSYIARERVFRRNGRNVRRENFPVGGTSGGEGAGWTEDGFTASGLSGGGSRR